MIHLLSAAFTNAHALLLIPRHLFCYLTVSFYLVHRQLHTQSELTCCRRPRHPFAAGECRVKIPDLECPPEVRQLTVFAALSYGVASEYSKRTSCQAT